MNLDGLSREKAEAMIRAYLDGGTIKGIARQFRVGRTWFRKLLAAVGAPIRDHHRPDGSADYLPTPEEIEADKTALRAARAPPA